MEGWLEHENGVQALRTWLSLQEDKLKKRHRIEDVASVQNALKDCQVRTRRPIVLYTTPDPTLNDTSLLLTSVLFVTVFFTPSFFTLQEMEELVKEKEKDLEKTEERGNALIQDKKGEACSVVKETLKELNQSWASLDQMVG